MDAASQALLQHIFLKESRSLLQYVSESSPWTSRSEQRILDVVLALAHEEQQALAKIVRFLLKHHIMPPAPVAFPSNFTTINMVSLEHLLPFLVDSQQKSVKELEQKLVGVGDEQARALASEYLAMKRRHLQALTEASHPGSSAPALAPAHA